MARIGALVVCALAWAALVCASAEPAVSDIFFYNRITGASTYDRPDTLPVLDEATGRHYWVIGGEATWDPPDADHAWVPHRDPDGHRYFENVLTSETTWTPPEPGAWETRSVSKKFYHNTVSKESTWERPPVLGHESKEHNATFYTDPVTGDPTWEKPPAARWNAHASENGQTFYHHPDTDEKTWEVPAESAHAWEVLHSEV